MITKDDVFNVLLEEFKTTNKPVPFSRLKRKLKDDPETLLNYLEELTSEGKVKKYEIGGGKSFEPITMEDKSVKTDEISTQSPIVEELKIIKDELKKMNDLISKVLEVSKRDKEVSYKDFDEAYERIKDSLGYAPLEKIRIELGLSKEDFYSKFREYIETHYHLIAGGEDGYVRKGVIYGIVRRRK
ncbi:MAG: hypothetical protein OWQ54_01955 [Sulfolobaceae archaeon]|nr:hypothetical protein [Sulfolobaceae archaeon]